METIDAVEGLNKRHLIHFVGTPYGWMHTAVTQALKMAGYPPEAHIDFRKVISRAASHRSASGGITPERAIEVLVARIQKHNIKIGVNPAHTMIVTTGFLMSQAAMDLAHREGLLGKNTTCIYIEILPKVYVKRASGWGLPGRIASHWKAAHARNYPGLLDAVKGCDAEYHEVIPYQNSRKEAMLAQIAQIMRLRLAGHGVQQTEEQRVIGQKNRLGSYRRSKFRGMSGRDSLIPQSASK